MKKLVLIIVSISLCLIGAIALSACGGSGDGGASLTSKELLIGTWDLVQVIETDRLGNATKYIGEDVPEYPSYFVFEEDGSGVWVENNYSELITWDINEEGNLFLYYLDGVTAWIYMDYHISNCVFVTTIHWDDGEQEEAKYQNRDQACN